MQSSKNFEFSRIFTYRGEQVLSLRAVCDSQRLGRAAGYAFSLALKRAEQAYPEACRQKRLLDDEFLPLTVELSVQPMLYRCDAVSFFGDICQNLGRAGDRVERVSGTYFHGRKMGEPFSLIGKSRAEVEDIILTRIEEDKYGYYPNARRRLGLFPFGFYLTEEHCVFYWQRGAIAPASAGVPSFLIPCAKEKGEAFASP